MPRFDDARPIFSLDHDFVSPTDIDDMRVLMPEFDDPHFNSKNIYTTWTCHRSRYWLLHR